MIASAVPKWHSKIVATLAACAAIVAQPCVGATIESTGVRTLDGDRDFLIASPASKTPGPMPLVLLLHGHGGSAANVLGKGARPSPLAAWLNIVDRDHVLVAALQGAKGADGQPGWNDCRSDAVGSPATDDMAFVRAAIAEVKRQYPVDALRVYAMGMSNGAMMAYRIALELEPPLAGFAAVSGSMAERSQCAGPKHPVSALIINGTEDPLVPYAGGQVHFGKRTRGGVIGVEDSARLWVHANGLSGEGSSEELPHLDRGDPTGAIRTLWGASESEPQVELIRIDHGGHVEPSIDFHYGALYSHVTGAQNRDFESAEEAWRFLRGKRAQERPAYR